MRRIVPATEGLATIQLHHLDAESMIGPAEPGDAAEIARVDLACRTPRARVGLPGEGVERETSRIWRSRLEQDPRSVTVLREGRRITGFAWAGPARDPDLDPARTAALHSFCIDSGAFDPALAEALWTAVRSWLIAQEYDEVVVWVTDEARASQSLYEGLGFLPAEGVQRRSTLSGDGATGSRYRCPLR